MKSRAFTILELLLVIAIVAVVAAIVFPYWAKGREKSRMISCASNEKQLGLSIMQYIQDNDQRFPGGLTIDKAGSPHGWSAQIYPYEKDAQLYRCPDDSKDNTLGKYVVSYFLNANLIRKNRVGLESANLISPAATVLFAEVADTQSVLTSTTSPSGYGDAVGDGSTTKSATGEVTGVSNGRLACGTLGQGSNRGVANIARHNGGSCFLFADGHCYWFPPEKVSPGRSANAANSPATSTTAAGTSANQSYEATFSPY